MRILEQWLIGVVCAAMVVSIANALMPSGPVKRIGKFVGGLVLLIALLAPLTTLDYEAMAETISASQFSAIEGQIQPQEINEQVMKTIIEDRTAAYISDKAQTMGISCEVRVETEVGGEGVPVPVRVRLETPYHPELSAWIEEELEIPEERQIWQEE